MRHNVGIGSGEFKVKIGEKEVGFRFGMLASSYTEQKAQKPIFKVFQEIATGRGSLAVLQYFYGGAVAYNEFNDIEEKVTLAQVSEWIEEMGLEEAMRIYSESIKTHLPKNGKAPKEEAGLKVE